MCRCARLQGLQLGALGQRTFTTYESNIAFVMRYMVDAGIVGANWVGLPAGKYLLRSGASNVQVEADVMWEHFESHAPDGEWLKVGPLRILSFDIECAGRKGFFPEAEKDPVIQIANWVSVQVRAAATISSKQRYPARAFRGPALGCAAAGLRERASWGRRPRCVLGRRRDRACSAWLKREAGGSGRGDEGGGAVDRRAFDRTGNAQRGLRSLLIPI
jgi:hypothetical protein